MNLPLLFAETATEGSSGINWHSFFFLLFALISCGMALAVLFSRNIVRMAFYLTVSLGAVSGLFILAGAHFVGAMQLMIYVGGTLVLLIFGVMLTAQAQFVEMKTRGGEWIAATVVGGALLAVLLAAAFRVESWKSPSEEQHQAALETQVAPDTTSIGAALIGLRNDSLAQEDAQLRAGMSGYFIHFEIVSVHLLIVLIGAAYLARARHSVGAALPAARSQPRGDRRRSLMVSILLFLATVVALFKAVTFFYFYTIGPQTYDERMGEYVRAVSAPSVAASEWWFWLAIGVLHLAIAFCLIAIMRWQQWGFCGLCVITVIIAMLAQAAIGPTVAVGTLLGGAIALGVLFGLLYVGGQRSIWSQME